MTLALKYAKNPAISISSSCSVMEAAKKMSQENVGALVVLDGSTLMGILSERDIISRVIAKKKPVENTKVIEVMTTNVRTVGEDVTTDQALQLMHECNFRHLPITDGKGNILGMLSIRDLLRQRIAELSTENKDLAAFLAADGIGG